MSNQELSIRAKSIWAKKRSIDGEMEWLPLLVHLTDTANISKMLFNHWLSERQREILAIGSDESKTLQLVQFIGFEHDIGKATANFEVKQSYDLDKTLDDILIEKLIRAGFDGLNSDELSSPKASPHAKAGEALLERFGVSKSIGAIIGGHHGRPLSHSPSEDIQAHASNYWQSDDNLKVQQRWQSVQKEIFEYGLHFAGFQQVADLPEITKPQAVLLEGLLIMSDWLASSEYLDDDPTKPLFPLLSLCQGFDDVDLNLRYQMAWIQWQQNDEWVTDRVSLSPDPYKVRWGFSARPVQKAVSKAVDAANDPGMLIIEAPMGMGKTEIALLAAEQLAYKSQETGLFFGLPTQATANAMFDRVDAWLKGMAQRSETSYSIKLMHSKAEFNESYQQIPSANQVGDEPPVVINRWFGGKKSILDEFTIGTIDNLLQLDLKQKHLALKHLGLSKKVVVIDEVHAYDAFMDQHLYRALEWLGAYHVPVVVLSATLPKTKRNQLLDSYFHGKYGKSMARMADFTQVPADWEESEAYPLVSILDGKQLQQLTEFEGQSDQIPLQVKVGKMGSDEDELVSQVLHAIEKGGVAGVIVNTIDRAQKLAAKFSGQVDMLVLHSAFISADRFKLEKKLEQAIGKNARRPDRLVVIGTQVLEQSLDIDFDVLFTDIAPIDLLLQRAGRLHRHAISRPVGLTAPRLVVAGIDGPCHYQDGSVAVYGQYLLMKTEAVLPQSINLPDDISRLVQQVYDLRRDPPLEGIDQAKAEFVKQVDQEEQKAKVFRIASPFSKSQKTLHGWLDNDMPVVDKIEGRAEAAVRDIDESIEAILLRHSIDADYLLDGTEIEPQKFPSMAKTIAQQTIRLPRVFSYKIDDTIKALEKQTARLYPAWQQNKWLRGAVAVPLNDELEGELMGYGLKYSDRDGLTWWKEE